MKRTSQLKGHREQTYSDKLGSAGRGPCSLSLDTWADPGAILLGKVRSKGTGPPPARGLEKRPWGLQNEGQLTV